MSLAASLRTLVVRSAVGAITLFVSTDVGASASASHPGSAMRYDSSSAEVLSQHAGPAGHCQPSTRDFDYIWIACSKRGTVLKLNTQTGRILGEYWSSPGQTAPTQASKDPSRTTVDAMGNVWLTNRAESEKGSVLKIGLLENGQCKDRNKDGKIETSKGAGNILPWPDQGDGKGNYPAAALVKNAVDECILLYQRLPGSPGTRHVSVNLDGTVWVGGYYSVQIDETKEPNIFHLLRGTDASSLGTFNARSIGCGGYGGLVDGAGILWSASPDQKQLLRYDPQSKRGTCLDVGGASYGLALDPDGCIWNALFRENRIIRLTSDGRVVKNFPVDTGGSEPRGVAVRWVDGSVWVANSGSGTVTRFTRSQNGTFVRAVMRGVGSVPTGVSVDASGNVWVVNKDSNDAVRINPETNEITRFPLPESCGPYNYSDMTGSSLRYVMRLRNVCPGLMERVPREAINAALANPARVEGWGVCCNPSIPASPTNVAREQLNLKYWDRPYHRLNNSLVWQCGCRGPARGRT